MMARIAERLVLPPEISDFERRYLGQVNRIALALFYAHLPLMMMVAGLCGTSIPKAALYTGLVLAGPTVAFRALTNPRAIARVFAFAAMCMGGVLVHVGQGPMQMEMHFHFFVVIALLAVFADPLVIVVAAVTVALHHGVLFVALPASVFNYEASVWAVVVHAVFVVVESVAACFVARSFFDNVIGLERIVADRTAELATRTRQLRVVMDNVAAGLLAVDMDGMMSTEKSAALGGWLGPCLPGETFWSYVARSDEAAAEWFELAWDMLRDVRFRDVALSQCQRRIRAGERTLGVTASMLEGGSLVLVMLTDVTAELERERLEAEQREVVTLCEHAVKDPHGVTEFLRETGAMVEAIALDAGGVELLRLLHTVKGNTLSFGATSVGDLCHAVESRIHEEGPIVAGDRAAIAASWAKIVGRMAVLRGQSSDAIQVGRAEHEAVVRRLRAGAPREAVADAIEAWRQERAEERLSRAAEHARTIARRLGRTDLVVVTEHDGSRLPDQDLSSLWSSFVHLVRNAVDHGIEPTEERLAKGKAGGGTITLRAFRDPEGLAIEVEDDGRGIDWREVAARARAQGLAAESHADLVEALFAEGLSTRDEATETSGRGIGLSAVRAECVRVGARLTVGAGAAGGTRLRITLPAQLIRAA